jgi:hypothetical protein
MLWSTVSNSAVAMLLGTIVIRVITEWLFLCRLCILIKIVLFVLKEYFAWIILHAYVVEYAEEIKQNISRKFCVRAEIYQSSGMSEIGTTAGSFAGHENGLLSGQVHCTTCSCSVALLFSKWHACQP